MALNRILSAAGAAMLGLTMASGAVNASIIGDVGLGFGKFLGTWENISEPGNTADDPVTMPNPRTNTLNVKQVGGAILEQHSGLFVIGEFNLAGSLVPFGDDEDNLNDPGVGFRVEDQHDGNTAKWTYSGFPDGPGSPSGAPVDLFIAVKYGDVTSVFQFKSVAPGQFGYLSSDFAEILAHSPPLTYNYGDLNYTNLVGTAQVFVPTPNPHDDPANGSFETRGCSVDVFSDICMPYNRPGTSANGVSHVIGYWPPVGLVSNVPEPASMTLLGAGLLGLGYIRRRKAA